LVQDMPSFNRDRWGRAQELGPWDGECSLPTHPSGFRALVAETVQKSHSLELPDLLGKHEK
jgi:hypothetical protein